MRAVYVGVFFFFLIPPYAHEISADKVSLRCKDGGYEWTHCVEERAMPWSEQVRRDKRQHEKQ